MEQLIKKLFERIEALEKRVEKNWEGDPLHNSQASRFCEPKGSVSATDATIPHRPLYGEDSDIADKLSQKSSLRRAQTAEPSSSPRGADAKERRLRRREVYLSRGVLPQQSIRRGLQLLLDQRTPDGRYLVTRKVHWQAVYRVLVKNVTKRLYWD